MSCAFEVNDGAYILGALAPAERAAFEQHLATCPSCRESVAALAVLPGLLGRLDPTTVGPAASAPPELLPRVLHAARARRRQQRRRQLLTTAAACLVTAALATVVGLGAQLFTRPPHSAVMVEPFAYTQMHPVGGYAPLVAEIGLRAEETGTVIAVRCLYHGQGQKSWPIWLIVYPRDDNPAEAIGSWVASPESQVNVTAVTRFTPQEIDRIELQGDDHSTIAWWSP